MCRRMGSHFRDWMDNNGVAFSIELLECGRTFSNFGVRELFVFTVSKLIVLCETKRNEMVLCETVTTQCFIPPYLEYLEFH